jgi:hypothetical protein
MSNLPRTTLAALCWVLIGGLCLAGPGSGSVPTQGGEKMNKSGKTVEGTQDVVIACALYSAETGGGSEELEIRGRESKVILRYKENYQSQPKTMEGQISAAVVARLVEMFDHEMFSEMTASGADNPRADLWVLTFKRKGTEKVVKRRGIVDAEFERLVGAVKMAAATALPEVSQGKFLPNL